MSPIFTRSLMTAATVVLVVTGLGCTFLPHELLARLGSPARVGSPPGQG